MTEIEKTKENTTFVISETEKPNSYESGKAGSRHKIYYNSVDELKAHIKELVDAGFIEEEPEIQN